MFLDMEELQRVDFKVASILPQPYLEESKDETYVMALAHLLEQPGMRQYDIRMKMAGASEDKFLIMDNGVIEGNPRPIEELIELGSRFKADEVVLPDAFRDPTKTKEIASKALEYAETQVLKYKPQYMYVPQETEPEASAEDAFDMYTNHKLITTIGVPKHLYEGNSQGRSIMVGNLISLCNEAVVKPPQIHLLGCWTDAVEIRSIVGKYGNLVRGVDSALPYQMARDGLQIGKAPKPHNTPISSEEFKDGVEGLNMRLLRANIEAWTSIGVF